MLFAIACCAVLGCKDRPPRDLPTGPTKSHYTNDLDHDGEVKDTERTRAYQQRLAATLRTLDRDGDGKVTVIELSVAEAPGLHFPEPERVDQNGDHLISADELGAALAQRRRDQRASWERTLSYQ